MRKTLRSFGSSSSSNSKTGRGTRRTMRGQTQTQALGYLGKIVVRFLETLNCIKLYHWKTKSYATHKATDELYTKLSENIDQFVEVSLGKETDGLTNGRINLLKTKSILLLDVSSPNEFKRIIEKFKDYLTGLKLKEFPKTGKLSALKTQRFLSFNGNTDLVNIRDDMLANINQFLYLFSFP